MTKVFIGIDPGLTGAVAAIDEHGRLLTVQDTPILAVKKGKGVKHIYLDSQMVTVLRACKTTGVSAYVALESVHSMPKQGVASTFSTGVGVGLWRGIIAALELPLTTLEPRRWKVAMGIAVGADKNASIVRALQLFPAADLRRKKDHGRADALLMAAYLRRQASRGDV